MTNKGKTYALGDTHGAHKALIQVLERCGFDKETDKLISLGDIADGWPEVPECVDELLTIKNLIPIRGNHDVWCWNWFDYGHTPELWKTQGGQATIDAYLRTGGLVDEKHKKFWGNQIDYYIDDENRLFVHGGFYDNLEVSKHSKLNIPRANELHWDRSLWNKALSGNSSQNKPKILRDYKEIYIGHTTTSNWGSDVPMNACNVWNLDTGAGWENKLTIMDIDTKEYWQSDKVSELYPDVKGR